MEPQQQKEVIFVDGYFTNDVPDSAPAFILGKGSFHVKKLKAWLEANEKYAVRDWISFTTMRSKNGTRYTAIDLYSWKKAQEKKDEPNPENSMELAGLDKPTINPETNETIPF